MSGAVCDGERPVWWYVGVTAEPALARTHRHSRTGYPWHTCVQVGTWRWEVQKVMQCLKTRCDLFVCTRRPVGLVCCFWVGLVCYCQHSVGLHMRCAASATALPRAHGCRWCGCCRAEVVVASAAVVFSRLRRGMFDVYSCLVSSWHIILGTIACFTACICGACQAPGGAVFRVWALSTPCICVQTGQKQPVTL